MQLIRKKRGRPPRTDKSLNKSNLLQVAVTGDVYKKITKLCKKEQITISSLLLVGINQKLAEIESKSKTKVKEIESNI